MPVRGMQIPLFYDFLKLHDMTAMNQLLELGWLRCDKKNNVVSVHPLIALLCRHSHLTKPSVDHCRTFLNSFSKYLRRPPTICDNDFSMSLAQNILTHTKCDSDKIEYIEFQDNYGYFQFLSGNYVASENNILSAVKALWKKRQYAKAVPVCIDYAMVLEIQRKMELEADFLHDLEELPEFRAVYQKEPQLYFEVLVIWGTWLRVQSQQKQAIDRLERAEALLDSENIKIFRQQMVAQLYYELSTCKYQIRKEVPGYLEQAEDAAWKSLRYREAEYGKADVSLANDYNTLGYIYKEKGDFNEAEKYQKMGYELRLKHYGPKNVYTCNALENWAMTLSFQLDRQDEAETKLLESLAIKKEILPANNAWTANTYWQLTKHYQRTSEWQKAIDCCTRALQIYNGQQKKFGFSIGLMLYEQARSYYEIGAYEDALHIAQKAYDMQYNDPRQGPERPSTKDTKKLLLDINQRLRAKDIDYFTIKDEYKKNGIFYPLFSIFLLYFNQNNIYYDYIVTEIGHQGSTKIDGDSAFLQKVLFVEDFLSIKAPYKQPELGLYKEETNIDANLYIRFSDSLSSIPKSTYLLLVKHIYYDHYLGQFTRNYTQTVAVSQFF